MPKKVVAIIGTYRKNHITDTAVTAVLDAAQRAGAETEKIYLIDKHIEFCTNCRTCTQQPDTGKRGTCPTEDDMPAILDQIDSADALVLASPVNFFTVTAVTKKFIERLVCYAYWPWSTPMPKGRIKKPDKKAVIITSTACPAFLARLLVRNSPKLLKAAATCLGAKTVATLYFGAIAMNPDDQLSKKALNRCRRAGQKLLS